MDFEGNIQDIGAESGPVQAFESFVPAALDGVDMGSFEPTESFEPAQPNPFKVTSAPSEALRTAQNQSESVAGVNTASGAAGSGGKSSEDKKEDAREYHARLAQIILSSLPQGDTSHLPHHDDDITIKVGDKTITMAQGDLFQLARKNASNPNLPAAQQLMWAQVAQTMDPRLQADTDKANKIIAKNPAAQQTIAKYAGHSATPTADGNVEASAADEQRLDETSVVTEAADDDLRQQILERNISGSRPPPVYELVDGPKAPSTETTLPPVGDAFASASLLPDTGTGLPGLLPNTGLDLASAKPETGTTSDASNEKSGELPSGGSTVAMTGGSGFNLG